MIILFIFSFFLGIMLAWRYGVRNARGVFIIYFIAGVAIPYIMSDSKSGISSFLHPFLKNTDEEAVALLSIAFLTSMVSSIISLRPSNIKVEPVYISRQTLRIFAVNSIIFFICHIAISIYSAGSIAGAIMLSYSRVRINDSLLNFRSVFFWGAVVFSTFAFYGMKSSNIKIKGRLLIYASLFFSAILSLADGGRSILVLFIISLFFRSILRLSSIKLIIALLIASVAISLLSSTMLFLRYTAQNAAVISERSIDIGDSVTGLVFIDHMQLSIQYAKENGNDYGSVYLNALLSVIPRAFNPDKAIPLSTQMRQYLYGDDAGGIPPGLFGEAYIAAGILGVIFISIVYGRMLRATSILCQRATMTDCPVRLATAAIMVPMIGFTLVRGGFDIGLLRVGLPFFWILIAKKLSTSQMVSRKSKKILMSKAIG